MTLALQCYTANKAKIRIPLAPKIKQYCLGTKYTSIRERKEMKTIQSRGQQSTSKPNCFLTLTRRKIL